MVGYLTASLGSTMYKIPVALDTPTFTDTQKCLQTLPNVCLTTIDLDQSKITDRNTGIQKHKGIRDILDKCQSTAKFKVKLPVWQLYLCQCKLKILVYLLF